MMTYLLHIINNNMKKQYGMTETSYGFGNGGRPFIPRFTEEAKYSAMSYYPKKNGITMYILCILISYLII